MTEQYNKYPISVREGKIFMDGVEAANTVSASIVWTWETWSGKELGNQTNINRPLGYTVKVTVTRRRSTPFAEDAIKMFKETGRVPEVTIQGIQADKASDYYQQYGGKVVTVHGCVPTGDVNLMLMDSKGEVLEDTLEFLASDVTFK